MGLAAPFGSEAGLGPGCWRGGGQGPGARLAPPAAGRAGLHPAEAAAGSPRREGESGRPGRGAAGAREEPGPPFPSPPFPSPPSCPRPAPAEPQRGCPAPPPALTGHGCWGSCSRGRRPASSRAGGGCRPLPAPGLGLPPPPPPRSVRAWGSPSPARPRGLGDRTRGRLETRAEIGTPLAPIREKERGVLGRRSGFGRALGAEPARALSPGSAGRGGQPARVRSSGEGGAGVGGGAAAGPDKSSVSPGKKKKKKKSMRHRLGERTSETAAMLRKRLRC